MPKQDKNAGQRHTRYSVYQTAQFRLISAGDDYPDLEDAIVLDFSFSGLRIACRESLDPGAEIGIRLICQGDPQDEIRAITRWSRPLNDGGYHHGMQFLEPGAILPFLGLDKDEYAAKVEAGPESPGVLQVVNTAKLVRIDRLRCVIEGDLEVECGASHAYLMVEGRLSIPSGEVVGGETGASMQMDLNTAGDSAHTPTLLHLAYLPGDFADVRTRARLQLSRDQAELADCKQRVESFSGADGAASHEDREQVMALMFEMQGKEAVVEQLREKIGLLDGLIERKTCAELTIRERVYPGVRIGVHGCPGGYEVSQEVAGPLTIRGDSAGHLFFVTGDGESSPLDLNPSFRRCA